MNMRIWNALAFGIGAYLATMVLIGHTAPAAAAYRRVHSSQCHYFNDDAGTQVYNGMYLANYTTGRIIYCAAPSDSELPHAATTELNVHGYAPSGTWPYSVACAKAYNTASYSCGTLKYWAAGYTGVYGVDVSTWQADFTAMPVVYNYLPAGGQLYGFYMAN